MNKKHGIDEYGIFLVWVAIIISVISYFTKSSILNIFSLIIVAYAVYRAFSNNQYKRVMENRMFREKFLDPMKKQFRIGKRKSKDKNYKYIKCPSCKQELRIPKNKGKIKVKCPKCSHKFDARS